MFCASLLQHSCLVIPSSMKPMIDFVLKFTSHKSPIGLRCHHLTSGCSQAEPTDRAYQFIGTHGPAPALGNHNCLSVLQLQDGSGLSISSHNRCNHQLTWQIASHMPKIIVFSHWVCHIDVRLVFMHGQLAEEFLKDHQWCEHRRRPECLESDAFLDLQSVQAWAHTKPRPTHRSVAQC